MADRFLFSGDHGDQPEAGEIMLWEQWDEKPLAVINTGEHFIAAIVVDDECSTTRGAINAARAQLKDWIGFGEDREYAKQELAAMLISLDEIDTIQAFGWQDRLADALRSLADQIAKAAVELNVNA